MESRPGRPPPGAAATRRRRGRRSSRRRARSSTSAATRARPSGRSPRGPASRTASSCGTSAPRSSFSSRRCRGRASPRKSCQGIWTRSRSASRRHSWRRPSPRAAASTPLCALIRSAASGEEVAVPLYAAVEREVTATFREVLGPGTEVYAGPAWLAVHRRHVRPPRRPHRRPGATHARGTRRLPRARDPGAARPGRRRGGRQQVTGHVENCEERWLPSGPLR